MQYISGAIYFCVCNVNMRFFDKKLSDRAKHSLRNGLLNIFSQENLDDELGTLTIEMWLKDEETASTDVTAEQIFTLVCADVEVFKMEDEETLGTIVESPRTFIGSRRFKFTENKT